jgi:hypothetical protein
MTLDQQAVGEDVGAVRPFGAIAVARYRRG